MAAFASVFLGPVIQIGVADVPGLPPAESNTHSQDLVSLREPCRSVKHYLFCYAGSAEALGNGLGAARLHGSKSCAARGNEEDQIGNMFA
jgi:hypothetical protein